MFSDVEGVEGVEGVFNAVFVEGVVISEGF